MPGACRLYLDRAWKNVWNNIRKACGRISGRRGEEHTEMEKLQRIRCSLPGIQNDPIITGCM